MVPTLHKRHGLCFVRFNVQLDSIGHIGDDILQVCCPNQQYQSTEGRWLVIRTGFSLTRQIHHVKTTAKVIWQKVTSTECTRIPILGKGGGS